MGDRGRRFVTAVRRARLPTGLIPGWPVTGVWSRVCRERHGSDGRADSARLHLTEVEWRADNWDAAAAHAATYLATLRGAEQADTRRAYGQVLRRMVAEFGAGTVLGDISVGQVAGQLRPR